nr:MAG TPA: hypothetical protein [Caudoviricetes sp.]
MRIIACELTLEEIKKVDRLVLPSFLFVSNPMYIDILFI